MPALPLIQTTGDLEVVVLFEAHDLLADIISDEYYSVNGPSPTEVRFHSRRAMEDFFVHAYELIAEGPNVAVEGITRPSLLEGLSWLCRMHPDEAKRVGLDSATNCVSEWLQTKKDVTFWCPELDTNLLFPLTRAELIKFTANLGKHRLLRLQRLMEQLRTLTVSAGVEAQGTALVGVREPFLAELHSRLEYLASWFIELLGQLWGALNSLVVARSREANTNDVRLMPMPEGVTSDAIRDLYGSTLVFKSYDQSRIMRFVPRVPAILKKRY